MSIPVFVGYKLKPVSYLNQLLPPTKDEKTVRTDGRIPEVAAKSVFTGTFDSVVIATAEDAEAVRFNDNPNDPPGMLARRIVSWLTNRFPGCWRDAVNQPMILREKGNTPNTIADPAKLPSELKWLESDVDPAYFVGFDPVTFMRILGIECQVWNINCPLSLWYCNTNYHDLGDMLLPVRHATHLNWKVVKAAYRLGFQGDDLRRYDEFFVDWEGPGDDPHKDVAAAIFFGVKLGLISSSATISVDRETEPPATVPEDPVVEKKRRKKPKP